MALGATIYKATLDISDLDRGWYGSRSLTVARHPSETEERMMVRILAFCLYADEKLEFGRGVSAEDEPDLWETNDAGDIGRWIDVGNPDNKALRRAAAEATMWWCLPTMRQKPVPGGFPIRVISARSISSRSAR